MNRAADLVIIGGGIVGCAAAYYLARRGVTPLLLERNHVAAQQSGRSFGFVRQQGRDPLELPLAMESNRLWQGLTAELGADVGWAQSGILMLAATEDRMSAFAQWRDAARLHGLETRLLRGPDLEGIIPDVQGSWAGALYTPSDGHAEPAKVTEAFARAAVARGATIRTGCAVRAIVTGGREITGVLTESGEIRTSRVVCAAGAWSAQLLRNLGFRLPQRLVRSTVARTTPAPTITRVGVWAPGVAFWQHRDGRLNLAAGSAADHDVATDSFRHLRLFLPNYWTNRRLIRFHVGRRLCRDLIRLWPASADRRAARLYERDADPPPNLARIRGGIAALRRLVPGVQALTVERSWAGYIDVTPDALPVLGELETPKGLVVATGFCGRGFALGPVVGRLVAELVTEGQASLDLHAFRPARFRDGALARARRAL